MSHTVRPRPRGGSFGNAATAGNRMLSVDRNPHDVLLHEIIQLSQNAASKSSRGAPSFPVMSSTTRACAKVTSTWFHKSTIHCFDVGGEKRLCFPQFICSVLPSFTVHDINDAVSKLNVNISVCARDQLDTIKQLGVVAPDTDSCGLITVSDAERLHHELTTDVNDVIINVTSPAPSISSSSSSDSSSSGSTVTAEEKDPSDDTPVKNESVVETAIDTAITDTNNTLLVQHQCLGGCKGRILVDKYSHPDAECVQCAQCDRLYSPIQFVGHSHKDNQEKHTCHWGFRLDNWRAYVHLQESIGNANGDAQRRLKEFKLQFPPEKSQAKEVPAAKRKSMDSKPDATLIKSEPHHPSLMPFKKACNGLPVSSQLPQASPFAGMDPLLVQYYTNLLAQQQQQQREQLNQQQLLVLQAAANLTSKAVRERELQQNHIKTADACAGLLALSTVSDTPSGEYAKLPLRPAGEPPKKHLLHQFEAQQRLLKLTDNDLTMNELIEKYVPNEQGKRLMHAKMAQVEQRHNQKAVDIAAQYQMLIAELSSRVGSSYTSSSLQQQQQLHQQQKHAKLVGLHSAVDIQSLFSNR